jgi:murein DD-endopeptidase MepM/ murein hydrolase activator NlpD
MKLFHRPAAGLVLMLLACGVVAADDGSAAALELRGEWRQGNVILGRTQPDASLSYNGRRLRVSPQGEFIIALDRDEKPDAELILNRADGSAETHHYTVAAREWQVQRIDGLPQDKVNPPAKALARIRKEQALITAARNLDSPLTAFTESFAWPSTGRISGVFGSQRILNGVRKNPHYGVDVAVPVGTPVRAPADGAVSLARADLYFTGGTLMLDHGHGLSSIMVHLSKLMVKEGEAVTQGQVIALSGMTGRATGPHLHWGINWFNSKVDPELLVPAMPEEAGEKK